MAGIDRRVAGGDQGGVALLAYLGLAILGWGGFAAFSHPVPIVLTIVLFALSGDAIFSGGNLSPGVRGLFEGQSDFGNDSNLSRP
jgi:hypothetical protein